MTTNNLSLKTAILCIGLLLISFRTHAADIWHVDASKPNDTGPGTEWASAFQTIQAAVNAAAPGDTILVTNGIYDIGGQPFGAESLTNRVSVWHAVHVTAVSTNPANTVIAGAPDPNTTSNGPASIRGIYLTSGATLSGFTVTNGHTMAVTTTDGMGGGIFAVDTSSIISNCIVSANITHYRGGGVYGGTYYDSIITGNTVNPVGTTYRGGGAFGATLHRSAITENLAYIGGGAANCTLYECEISRNLAFNVGGVADTASYDSDFVGNIAYQYGATSYQGYSLSRSTYPSTFYRCNISEHGGYWAIGGYFEACRLFNNTGGWDKITMSGTFVNCLIYANVGGHNAGQTMISGSIIHSVVYDNAARPGTTSTRPGGTVIDTAFVRNSVVYDNHAGSWSGSFFDNSPDFSIPDGSTPNAAYTCTSMTNNLAGPGNITNAPMFANTVSNDFSILRLSPCVDAGTQVNNPYTGLAITNDIVGTLRPLDGTGDGNALYDMGAYEYILPARGTLFYSQ